MVLGPAGDAGNTVPCERTANRALDLVPCGSAAEAAGFRFSVEPVANLHPHCASDLPFRPPDLEHS